MICKGMSLFLGKDDWIICIGEKLPRFNVLEKEFQLIGII